MVCFDFLRFSVNFLCFSLIFHENSDFVSTKRFQTSISNEKSRGFCKALCKYVVFFRSKWPSRNVSSRRNRFFYKFRLHQGSILGSILGSKSVDFGVHFGNRKSAQNRSILGSILEVDLGPLNSDSAREVLLFLGTCLSM